MATETAGVRDNIWKLKALEACNGGLIAIPIIVYFLQDAGLSLKEVFLLEAAFSLVIVILEIPTGYLSDRWGRKHTLIAGSFFLFLGFFIFTMSRTFEGFLVGEILMAIGRSLDSGSMDALAYDSLLAEGKADNYRKIRGEISFWRFSAEAVGSLLGGALALIGLRTALWATLIPFGIGFLVTLTLTEPARHKLIGTGHWKALWNITTHTLIRSIPMRSIVLISGLLMTLGYCLFWLTQPYQQDIGLPLYLYGITHAVFVIGHAISARQIFVVTRRFDDRKILLTISCTLILCYFALGIHQAYAMLVFFLLGRIAWGALTPVTSDMLNRLASSDVRATVLSIQALFARLLFAISSPFLGYFADLYTLKTAFLLAGGIGGLLLVAAFIMVRPAWGKIPR